MQILKIIAVSAGLVLSSAAAQSQEATNPQDAKPGAQAQAQTWTGTLVDAACKASNANEACEVSPASKSFGLQTSDAKYVKFDQSGNMKVRAALQASSNKTGAIKASVSGTLTGEELAVDSVQLQS